MAVIEEGVLAELGGGIVHVLNDVREWLDVLRHAEFLVAVDFEFALESILD